VPEGDEDAVRVMTIHAAKGLEFPIVLLTGLNGSRSPRNESVLFGRESGRVEARLGAAGAYFQTPGYLDLAEQEKERAAEEVIRLMYVASTRARDHLILSLYRTAKDQSSLAARIAQHLDGQDHLWQQISQEGLSPSPMPGASGLSETPAEDTPEACQRWQEERARLLRHQGRPAAVAATTLAQEAKEEQDSPEAPWRRGRGGTSLGRAVHAILQTVDLSTGPGLEGIARAQAAAEGILDREREILALVRQALTSPVVRRAVASGRWWREVPVAAPVRDGVLEGFIDLLFEEDGQLVVVDYKTDALASEEEIAQAMQRYRLQGGAYTLALQKATWQDVKEVVFLFLQPHQEVTLKDVDALTQEAERAATAFIDNMG
jgi:ATP-dependent helicase/nuclease subunit A